jgi:hypothetical protein
MAEDRPILNALKQAFAAMIPVLLAWLMKMMVPAATTVKVASRTKKVSDATNGSSGGTSVEV